MLPPKRHDPIKAGIRARLQREKHQKTMRELDREIEKTVIRWKLTEAKVRALLT